jgi:hypothetical protein
MAFKKVVAFYEYLEEDSKATKEKFICLYSVVSIYTEFSIS